MYLTNYGQNAYFWIFLKYLHGRKSKNAIQNRSEQKRDFAKIEDKFY
jgi:hypothetical protein